MNVRGLEQVAGGEAPHSQRAQALLALADGADLAGAGITAGLTVNQVRYWLGRFGSRRLSIFPAELLAAQTSDTETKMEPPLLDAPEEAPLLKAPELAGELPESVAGTPKAAAAAVAAVGGTAAVKSKKDKSKKAKKAKKEKKSKKVKKEKKSKKDKKPKKEKKSEKVKKAKKAKKAKKDKKSKKSKKKK